MIKVSTGLKSAHMIPRVACLYCARKSRSASVKMISRCAHSFFADESSARLVVVKELRWWCGRDGRNIGNLERALARRI